MTSAIDRILATRWWYALASLAILLYVFTACQLADNAPKYDDLNDVFGFFKQLALAQGSLAQAGAFFYPNNEHITLVDHAIYYLQYQLIGSIRFYPLILVGHVIVIATGLLLGAIGGKAHRPFSVALLALAYINLHYWDSTFKAMTAISNQAVILFALATFFALQRWRHFPAAVLCAFLATFSQGNGVLVWPAALLILLCDPYWRAARTRHLGRWLLCGGLSFTLFVLAHVRYDPPGNNATTNVLDLLLQHPLLPLQTTLAFLGSTLFTAGQLWLAILTGCCALLVFAWHACRPQRQLLLLATALFLLASAITASGLRGLIAGDAASVLESRYKMYSVGFVLLALLSLLEQARGAQKIPAAALLLLVSVTLHASGYQHIAAIRQQAQKFHESYQYWLIDGDFRRQAVFFPPMSDHFLFVAEHLGVFDIMQLAPNGSILEPLPTVQAGVCQSHIASQADQCPMTLRHRGNAIAVAIEAAVDRRDNGPEVDMSPALPANITLCDAQAQAVMAFAIPDSNPRPVRWLIPEGKIPAGTYRVLFQSAQQAVCETQLTKKPRKVETEMRTLFGR